MTDTDSISAIDIDQPTRPGRWHLWVLLVGLLGLGFYFQLLNQLLYVHKAPFYDSVSYYDRLFEVHSLCEQQGVLAAFRNAVESSSTTCLPFLLGIPFSFFIEPTRAVGVWIEWIYLAIFAFSFAHLLRRLLQASSTVILFCLVPFLLMNALHRSVAGMSDLRVDLPMAFLYVSAACWFLMGFREKKWSCFLIGGLLMGAACLSRALAPVYLVSGFLPLFVIEVIRSEDRKKTSLHILFSTLCTVAVAGWYYVAHFRFLYYYYFTWNTDANAGLPFPDTLRHFLAVAKSVGPCSAMFFLFVFMLSRAHAYTTTAKNAPQRRGTPLEFGWFIWLGLAPIILLVVKGADINPFVSLPGALALVACWVIAQFPRIQQVSQSHLPRMVIVSALLLGMSGMIGYLDHARRELNNADGHREIIEVLLRDADDSDAREITYSVNLMSSVTTVSLKSMMQFEHRAHYVDAFTLEMQGVQVVAWEELVLPARANWDKVPGDAAAEKISFLEQLAAKEVDYLILPTSDSLGVLQTRYHYCYCNRFAEPMLERFHGTGHWQAVSGEIQIEPGIRVRVFRRVR
ncbi:MAG: hypothetical protein VX768_03240 [Planctomycetota bacterium]|nr:hypothetical protein [Planctomycetota bacterium]